MKIEAIVRGPASVKFDIIDRITETIPASDLVEWMLEDSFRLPEMGTDGNQSTESATV